MKTEEIKTYMNHWLLTMRTETATRKVNTRVRGIEWIKKIKDDLKHKINQKELTQ